MDETNESGGTTAAEVAALTALVQALKGLPRESHRRVIDAALVLLGASPRGHGGGSGDGSNTADVPTDIRRLTEMKQPKSASEMAAVVAYYLAEAASPGERKETVENADMLKYFKQAKFRLPGNTSMILVSAKNSGYFDSAGAGQYRLNPVGYNLVAHSLPRSSGGGPAAGSRKRSRRARKAKRGRKS